MHYSGLVVLPKPGVFGDCIRELEECPGIEVFVADETSDRIVAVLVTDTVQEQENGLRHAQRLAHVASAELVYHYFGDAPESSCKPPVVEQE